MALNKDLLCRIGGNANGNIYFYMATASSSSDLTATAYWTALTVEPKVPLNVTDLIICIGGDGLLLLKCTNVSNPTIARIVQITHTT